MLLWAKAAARRAREGQAAAEEAELQAAGLGLTNSRPELLDQVCVCVQGGVKGVRGGGGALVREGRGRQQQKRRSYRQLGWG
jgi:hypothetical protein